jgi:hypothetical protein
MPRSHLAAPLTAVLLLATALPLPPAQPNAFLLDGLRDPGYVLVAEDPAGDLEPDISTDSRYLWADLTRLYLAKDESNLYVYADLPNYTAANASGQIGLALTFPDSTETGEAPDPWLDDNISYAFAASSLDQCASIPMAVRPPDVLIRGNIFGQSALHDPNNGFTILAKRQNGGWHGAEANWGRFRSVVDPRHIEYLDTAGVELFIPWSDLGLPEPSADLQLSFFSTSGAEKTGIFDSIPPDPQVPAPVTSTALSQLQTVALPLPAPNSVTLGCDAATVDEDAGPATLTAQLHTVLLTQTVSISYTTSALTAGYADFTPTTGTLTFGPGTTRQTIEMPVTDDTEVEGPETFLLTLTNPVTTTLAAPYTATITIVDDDGVGAFDEHIFVPFVRR